MWFWHSGVRGCCSSYCCCCGLVRVLVVVMCNCIKVLCNNIQLIEIHLGNAMLGMYSMTFFYCKLACGFDKASLSCLRYGRLQVGIIVYRCIIECQQVCMSYGASPLLDTAAWSIGCHIVQLEPITVWAYLQQHAQCLMIPFYWYGDGQDIIKGIIGHVDVGWGFQSWFQLMICFCLSNCSCAV